MNPGLRIEGLVLSNAAIPNRMQPMGTRILYAVRPRMVSAYFSR